jgi:hypothetical protein
MVETAMWPRHTRYMEPHDVGTDMPQDDRAAKQNDRGRGQGLPRREKLKVIRLGLAYGGSLTTISGILRRT